MNVELLLQYFPVGLLQSASNGIVGCQEVGWVEIWKSLHNTTTFNAVVFRLVLPGRQLFPFVLFYILTNVICTICNSVFTTAKYLYNNDLSPIPISYHVQR